MDKNDTNSAVLPQDELINGSIICIHLIQILIRHLRVSPGPSETNVEKGKCCDDYIQIVFSFVENKDFPRLVYYF